MAGLVPAIHVLLYRKKKDVDARHKAGHDELGYLQEIKSNAQTLFRQQAERRPGHRRLPDPREVPYAFGLCGHGNIQFIDALHERQSDIKTISVHHESVCGFMADAYYRVSGQPVATFTSCGPGSMNLPIALATAYLDSLPFLAVTGNVPTSQFGRGAFQELYRQHQADFRRPCAASARRCTSRLAASRCR